jgi:CO/xanthine dehydrogenase Mo-binding subunit
MELRKSYFADERKDDLKEVGQSRQRFDAVGHVTGATAFFADRNFPGLLHLKMVRSPHHHARIRSIDTSVAAKHPGVVRILTAKDVPHNVYTILILIQIGPEDETVLATDKVRWKGEAIVAVLAETERAAQEAVAKVKVDYEILPAVFSIDEALKPGAPLVNEYHGQNYYGYDSGECRKVRYGDVDDGFRRADHILEQTYASSPIEHAPTETTGCIVAPEGNGRFACYTNTQAMFFTLDNASIILQMPGHQLHLVGGTVGGGFGGKVDVIVEPIAILGAKLTGRPVSFVYSRQEEMQISSPRAAEKIVIKDGLATDGRIIARQVTAYTDAGAYSRHSPYGAQKGAAHFPGPYTIPNVWIDS